MVRGFGLLNTNILRACVGLRSALFGVLALAIAFLWISPANALPSFAAQVGVECAACHVGGFGPQLRPFGMLFRAEGFTLQGGTGPWSHIPLDLIFSPSLQTDAKDLPTAPAGYGTNNFFNVLGSGTALYIAAGRSLGDFGVGGFEQWGLTMTPGGSLSGSEATSVLTITKPLRLGDHSLVLGFDLTNTPSGGDPYNSLYNGFQFPYITPPVGPTPSASPAIAALGTTVYGMSLYAFYDESIYAEAGLYQTWSTSLLNTMNVAPSSLGTIAGTAPYFRLAYQHTQKPNFYEIGAAVMSVPLNQVPGVPNPSLQNQFFDWGFDATYQRNFPGGDTLAITSNILFETQTLTASHTAVPPTNASDWLNQFRIAASYYWQDTYGLTLAFTSTYGSTDPALYSTGAPLTGSANGSPNSQAIIAQIDWTPYGTDTTHPGYPWLNVRVGLQYTYYLRFNGGTTNYDGFGRNATDNNTLFFFTWWAF